MTLVAEHPNPLAVLDAVIADMRASGDTGNVENLLQARADFADLISAARSAFYVGLMVGHDCAYTLAALQNSGAYKPRCHDGRPSNADANKDKTEIASVAKKLQSALAKFESTP